MQKRMLQLRQDIFRFVSIFFIEFAIYYFTQNEERRCQIRRLL